MNERELRASRERARRKLRLHQRAALRLKQLIARRNKQISNLERTGPGAAAKFLVDRYGRTEQGNRAGWLDEWAKLIGPWMVGQPWCGLAVWMAARAGGVTLTKETVSTVAIRNHARAGTGGFRAWHPPSAKPQIGWVAVYGTGGPVHTGMYVGNGIVAEGNTSPGSGGSQNDGGGLYPRKLSERRGWLLGWAEIDWSKAR